MLGDYHRFSVGGGGQADVQFDPSVGLPKTHADSWWKAKWECRACGRPCQVVLPMSQEMKRIADNFAGSWQGPPGRQPLPGPFAIEDAQERAKPFIRAWRCACGAAEPPASYGTLARRLLRGDPKAHEMARRLREGVTHA